MHKHCARSGNFQFALPCECIKMIANVTESFGKVIRYKDPVYSLVPIPWVASAVITLECFLIISYLRSKPPLSQTIMDFMIGAFFIGSIPWSMLVALFANCLMLFQDSGEILGSLVSYVTPAIGDNLLFQLTTIFVVQAIMVKRTTLLESEHFNTVIKGIFIFVIPTYSICLHLYAYLAGFHNNFYIVARGMCAQTHHTWSIMRLCSMMPLLIAFIISRVWLRLSEHPRNEERSNHILNTKGVLIITIGHISVGKLVFLLMELKKSLRYASLIPVGSLTLASVFGGVVIINHPSIRNHICQMYPFNVVSRRITIRHLRQVGNNEPIYGLKL